MNKWRYCEFILSSLTFYQKVAEDHLILKLRGLLSAADRDSMQLMTDWAAIYRELVSGEYHGSLADYLFERVLFDDNLFTRECAKGNFEALDPGIRNAVLRDLYGLSVVASLECDEIKENLCSKLDIQRNLIYDLPDWSNRHQLYFPADSWDKDILRLAEFAKNNGFGMFAKYYAFEFSADSPYYLRPVREVDSISLKELKEYRAQRDVVIDNTLALLSGHPASNILLYGDRGTGKSSTVKAVANEYIDRGLKIVQIFKKDLGCLREILETLSQLPFPFIIFVDDLTFEEDDREFSLFKAVLEGSLVKRSENVVLYVTSNRRHLVRESFSSRGNDDVHRSDTIHETVSLSDRFGITVTFTVPNKQKFFEIVLLLAADLGITGRDEELKAAANRYACKKGDFSPRTARQFVDHAASRLTRDLEL